jgi:hypothetical protein
MCKTKQGQTVHTCDQKGTVRVWEIAQSGHQSTQMSGMQAIDPLINYSGIVDNTCQDWNWTKNNLGPCDTQL